jgi:large subunit ribosomal protein L21
MKYAVVRIKGQQFKISEDSEFLVDKITGKIEPEVLLVADGEKVEIGTPVLTKAKVSLKTEEDVRGKKVTAQTFKAKSRQRKNKGFRPTHTKIKVGKITI